MGVLLENVPEFLFLLGGAALGGATIVGHQLDPTRRGAGPRHPPHRLRADRHRVVARRLPRGARPRASTRAACWWPTRADVRATRSSARRAARRRRSAGTAAYARPPCTCCCSRPGRPGAPKAVRVSQGRIAAAAQAMASGVGVRPRRRPLLRHADVPRQRARTRACSRPSPPGRRWPLRRRFSASAFLPDVRRFGATYFNYVGRALAYVLATPPSPDDADNRLRFGFGTEASPQDISTFRRRFGCPIVEGYGSSEGAISMTRGPGRHARPWASRRRAWTSPSWTRPPGEECAPARLRRRRAGCSTPTRPSARSWPATAWPASRATTPTTRPTPSAPAAGWFWSGDLGYRDEEGFFYFAGRPADWLRVDGENFAAAPVERVLGRFPGAVAVAVYPVPDPRTGDQVMAAMELAPGAASIPTPSPPSSPASPTWGRSGRRASCGSSTTSRSRGPTRWTSGHCGPRAGRPAAPDPMCWRRGSRPARGTGPFTPARRRRGCAENSSDNGRAGFLRRAEDEEHHGS